MTALLPNTTSANVNHDEETPVPSGPVAIENPCFAAGGLEIAGIDVPSASKLRQILAVLLIAAGKGVPQEVLIKELWGDNAPRSSVGSLHTYITKLRRLFGDHERDRKNQTLYLTRAGYHLRVEPSLVDVLRFTQEAKGIYLYGDESKDELEVLKVRLENAFSLIRGTVLDDVQRGVVLNDWLRVFKEDYRQAQCRWVEVTLKLGRYDEVIVKLLPDTITHPYREDFVRWRMLALYCRSRGAEALRLYRKLRGVMIETLGIEPGPQTQSLHSKILNGDKELLRNPLPFV